MLKQLLRGVSRATFALFFVYFLIFIKDLVLGQVYGVTESLDLFLLAYIVPITVLMILAEPVSGIVAPEYIHLKQVAGGGQAAAYATRGLACALFGGLGIALLLLLFADLLHGILRGSKATAQEALRFAEFAAWLFPCVLLGLLSRVCASLLFAEGRYMIAASSAALPPAGMILLVWCASSQLGVMAAAVGVFAGCLLECGILIFVLWRLGVLSFVGENRSGLFSFQGVSRFFALMSAGGLLALLPIIDQLMYRDMPGAGVSVLVFAYKLNGLMYSAATLVLGNVLMTVVAERSDQSKQSMRAFFLRVQLLAGLVIAAIVTMLTVYSYEVSNLLFGRGAMGHQEVRKVAEVMAAYALAMPGLVVSVICIKFIAALRGRGSPLWQITVFAILGNIFLNGFAGVSEEIIKFAYSTAFISLVAGVILLWVAWRLVSEIEKRNGSA